MKPGTIKRSALEVLHAAGAGGMPIGAIMDAIKAQNLRQWDAKSKRVVQFVRSPRIMRVADDTNTRQSTRSEKLDSGRWQGSVSLRA